MRKFPEKSRFFVTFVAFLRQDLSLSEAGPLSKAFPHKEKEQKQEAGQGDDGARGRPIEIVGNNQPTDGGASGKERGANEGLLETSGDLQGGGRRND